MNNEPIATIVEEVPVVEADVLNTDYEGDEGAEFYCYLVNTMNFIRDNLFSNECEPTDFFNLDEDGNMPYLMLEEMINELRQFRWARRTWRKMERVTAGIPPAERLSQLEKSQHPDYKDWCCDKCGFYYKGARGLKEHKERDCCLTRHTLQFSKGVGKKLPTKNYIHIAMGMNKLLNRVVENQKLLAEELEEEVIEDEPITIVYQLDSEGEVEDEVEVCDKCDNEIDEDDKKLVELLQEKVESFEPSATFCKDCWVNDFYTEMKEYPENEDAEECYDIASEFCGYCYKDGVTKK